MPKNIFHSVILLVCISLAFVGNAYSFIHPVGEESVQDLCFPGAVFCCEFCEFLRTPFLQNISGRLLLSLAT